MRPLLFVSLLVLVTLCLALLLNHLMVKREWSLFQWTSPFVRESSGKYGVKLAEQYDLTIFIRSKHEKSVTLSIEKQIRDVLGTRNVSNYIPLDVNSILINWHTSNLALKVGPLAIILVSTTPEAKLVRVRIRKTWYKWSQIYNVKIIFFMGLPKNGDLRNIFLESTTYDDIVMDGFQEDFYHLPLKTLRMMKWFTEFYDGTPEKTKPKYFIKLDQDVFINIPNVFKHLKQRLITNSKNQSSADQFYLGGLLHLKYKVTRKYKSKFFVPMDIYVNQEYPPYIGGSCYFMSSNLVSKIFYRSYTVPLFHIEDVYITGMIANQALGVQLTGISPDLMVESQKKLQSAIRYKNTIWSSFSYHPVDLQLMSYLYETVERYVHPSSLLISNAPDSD